MNTKKKILIVEDDQLFREVITTILNKNYEVVGAANGRDAKNLIILTKFDLIISDVQMPYLTGIELLQWVRDNHPCSPPLKFILMTGFSNILETQKSEELEVDDFLTKPFSDNDLFEAVRKQLAQSPSEEASLVPVSLDNNYCKVQIEDFVSDKEFHYDIFLRINEFKYLKIDHKGGKISDERIQAYKEKGIHYFYVKKNDFVQLVNFTLYFSKVVVNSDQIEIEKKNRFVIYTGEMIVQQIYSNGLNEASLVVAKEFITLCLETICQDPVLLNLLSNFNEHADYLYAHSVAVGTFSVMIARVLGWTRQTILFKLVMAGLFHDIGKKDISREVLLKSRMQLSQQEQALIETHPFRGKEILESLRQIPADVVAVAFEHHENILESGYPRRISKLQIHPLCHIVTVANIFSKYTIKNPSLPNPVHAKIAILKMEKNYKDLIDPLSFEALKRLVLV